MTARNRKVDMRGLVLQLDGLEVGGTEVLDDGQFVVVGSDYKFTHKTYKATITIANGATTGKEAAIGMPANFLPKAVALEVTTAAVNAVTLVDVGDDAGTDSYIDGIAAGATLDSTGFKGIFGCNGVRANGVNPATTTADEVEVVVSGDPGGDTVIELTFYGVLCEAV